MGALAGVLLVVIPVAWLLATDAASITVDPRVADGASAAVLLTIAVKLLLVLFEELVFRAGVVRTFSRYTGVMGAVVLGAAAFGAAHGRDVVSSAVLFADGIGFGVAYVATGSLRAPIAWHAAKNLTVWVLAGRSTIEFAASPLRLAFPDAAPTGSTVAELVSAVIIVAAMSVWLLRSVGRREPAGAEIGATSTGSVSADAHRANAVPKSAIPGLTPKHRAGDTDGSGISRSSRVGSP